MEIKQESSAGAIIVVYKNACWFVLCIRDMNNMLTFPKGIIEEGELAKEAAIRETKEETGITDLTFIRELPPISYSYARDGHSVDKTVTYFLYELDDLQKPTPQKEEGITEVLWVPINEARHIIGYPNTNGPILEEVARIVNKAI